MTQSVPPSLLHASSGEIVQPELIRVHIARRTLGEAQERYHQAVVDARAAGLSLARIGKAAQVSRQAIAKTLKDDA